MIWKIGVGRPLVYLDLVQMRVWVGNMVAGLDDKIACADNGLCHQPLPQIEKC